MDFAVDSLINTVLNLRDAMFTREKLLKGVIYGVPVY